MLRLQYLTGVINILHSVTTNFNSRYQKLAKTGAVVTKILQVIYTPLYSAADIPVTQSFINYLNVSLNQV